MFPLWRHEGKRWHASRSTHGGVARDAAALAARMGGRLGVEALAARIGMAVADRAQPPRWNAGDAFGRRHGVAQGMETAAPR